MNRREIEAKARAEVKSEIEKMENEKAKAFEERSRKQA